ncbi:MAG: chemotaxis protein CheW [Ignavibacteriales bacterium]|nr:chemotaxis protein CheW [Ignavibacteriales bacterium]
MSQSNQLVSFTIDGQLFALHLRAVTRTIRAVEVTPLPHAPEIIIGVINVQGSILPVFNTRKRFHLPEREIALNDQFVLAVSSQRAVALVVDAVKDVVDVQELDIIRAERILPAMEYVEGVVKLESGLLLIHNLDTFLSLDEGKLFDEAVAVNNIK